MSSLVLTRNKCFKIALKDNWCKLYFKYFLVESLKTRNNPKL